jgi:glycine oxidase
MTASADLIIIGGGVIGCSIAERARKRMDHISLIEAAPMLGIGASSAAIGGITPQSGDFCLGPLGAVAQRSRELYPAWLARICHEAQMEIPVLNTGQLQIALDALELARIHEEIMPNLVARGIAALPLTRRQLLAEEPLLANAVLGGLLLPTELAIEPELLMKALRTILLRDERVRVLLSTTAVELTATGDAVQVSLADGTTICAEQVVVAAGHLSNPLLHLPDQVMFPVKGQALEFAAERGGRHRLHRQCYARTPAPDGWRTAYAVPRQDGRVTAGVTYEAGVTDTRPTRSGRESIVAGVSTLIPAATRWRISRHWAGIRPASSDGAPLIGHVDQGGRVIAATGHYGLGITLAPVTADHVTTLLAGDEIDEDRAVEMKVCDPARFDLATG